jgi:diaminohydroxyphosphoribosylaminopyrimidine deaminase / 5-amino-6-(5-phosphoribosylamino)uracil reductase
MENSDTGYMDMALELAQKGRGFTSPNPMVGAIIVAAGKIVGRGWHKAVGGPHAEINAIEDARGQTHGATMYVTLEPCNHQGRTPPCTRAIIKAGISKVVVAMADPNPAVSGGGSAYLRKNGIAVVTGICETAAQKLNVFFIKHATTGLPYVILKCASTLDGKTATITGDSKWITGPAAREHVHHLRHAVDAILVGVDTVRADDPQLTTRLGHGQTKDPVRIILDSRLTIPEHAGIISDNQAAGTILVTGPQAGHERRKNLLEKGVRIIETPLKNGLIDLPPLMKTLGTMGISSILAEGGSRVAASMLNAGVVDRVCFFFAPKILAGDGIPICRGRGPENMSAAIHVENIEVKRFDEDILVEGDIIN